MAGPMMIADAMKITTTLPAIMKSMGTTSDKGMSHSKCQGLNCEVAANPTQIHQYRTVTMVDFSRILGFMRSPKVQEPAKKSTAAHKT